MVSAIELDHVGFSYDGGDGAGALRDVCLSVPAGQCVVLTGPSGCGKTTVTRLVNGLIPAAYAGDLTGEVRVAGRAMSDWDMHELCRAVGSVFQNPRSQFFNLDTTSEVAFGCENVGLTREEIHARVDEAFSALGIDHLRDRDIFSLSGGQRQMVALASAYALGPDVFVLDEPTASLDVESMFLLAGVVRRLKEAGKTVVVAEHRLWWIVDVADRVVVMDRGAIAFDGPARDFAAVPSERRRAWGLRAWSTEELLGLDGNASDRGDGAAQPGDGVLRGLTGARPQSGGERFLVVEGLRARHGSGKDVLCGLDVALPCGVITALVGRNGAGKTTLARCLAGLHREAAGRIAFSGEVSARRARPRFAYLVMQETGYQLFSDHVRGELEDVREDAQGGGGASAEELLERFDLRSVADRHPLSLSGGQRQRLALAAGVVRGAPYLILDEPTSGLDRANMDRVADALREVSRRGVGVAVITHDLELVRSACDAVVAVRDGQASAAIPVCAATIGRIAEEMGFPAAEGA